MQVADRELVACKQCQNNFLAYPIWVLGDRFITEICDACARKNRVKRTPSLLKDWKSVCPPDYMTIEEGGRTDLNRLLSAGPKVSEVMNWRPDEIRSMIVYSAGSGLMKTRAVWRCIKGIVDNRSINIEAMNGQEFETHYSFALRSGNEQGFFKRMKNCFIFFVDDIDKSAWNRKVKAAFFDVFKSRCEFGKTMILTTNQCGKQWMQGFMNDEYGEPIIRRIRQYFHQIEIESTNEPS